MTNQPNSIVEIARNVINGINGTYAVITLILSYFLYFFSQGDSYFAFILSAYFLFLIPTLIISLVFALLTLNRWIPLLLLPTILILAVYMMPYFTPKPVVTPTGETIRVMSYNLKNLDDVDSYTTFANLVAEINPDIVAFQEYQDSNYFRWEESNQLATLPNIANNATNSRGQAVYTRFPILGEELIIYESSPFQRVLLDINGVETALYNIHPGPPIDWSGGIVFSANQADIDAHSLAMQQLTARIRTETIPVILVGDMNMSDRFPEYTELSTILFDSFLNAGNGFGFTYPANTAFPELMRLDYIFHNGAFQTVSAEVVRDTDTSDHLPVVAELQFRQ